jgi:hypothetical protein
MKATQVVHKRLENLTTALNAIMKTAKKAAPNPSPSVETPSTRTNINESVSKMMQRTMTAHPSQSNINTFYSGKASESVKLFNSIERKVNSITEDAPTSQNHQDVIREILDGVHHKKQVLDQRMILKRREAAKAIVSGKANSMSKSRMLYQQKMAKIKEEANAMNVYPEDRPEVQDLHQSIFHTTPLIEELFEAPEPADLLKANMSVGDINKMSSFKPPVQKKQIERSLVDEFNEPVFATKWEDFQVENPSFLQAATMLQNTQKGQPLTFKDAKAKQSEIEQLAHEIETGDYSRYADPDILLSHLPWKESCQQVQHIMLHAAQTIGHNNHIHPQTRKEMMTTIYSVVSRLDKKTGTGQRAKV